MSEMEINPGGERVARICKLLQLSARLGTLTALRGFRPLTSEEEREETEIKAALNQLHSQKEEKHART